ncbi:hypothetical protein M422DRAFT_246375 [Sphaerobolus stellatus SS14]|nr:hypothetical protein M422DRAFT_246375 [Sphaerobolus stellatus SS14]
MTDAFLTASVLAAVAARPAFPERRVEGKETTTRIIGIANQRRVWCLIKFGMKTTELDDGLKGRRPVFTATTITVLQWLSASLQQESKGLSLRRSDALGRPGPAGGMDDLHNKIGISVEGVDLEKVSGSDSQTTHDPAAPVFIIGMRGAGESHVTRLAGQTLDWKVVDADSVLAQKSKNCIISLGGGIVESPEARDVLKDYVKDRGPVVNVLRREDTVVAYLEQDVTRPAYGESVRDVFRPLFAWVANVDVEIDWSAKLQEALKTTKGASQIIASWQDWSGNMCWDGADVRENQDYRQGQGLPHRYSLDETEVIDKKIKAILKLPDFGGASVTIPLKLDIVPSSYEVSPDTKLIGAVNTIIVRTAEDGTQRLSRCTKSLVIGGGGTSRAAIFALHNLDATTIYLYNWTRLTAEKLAKHFPSDYNIVPQRTGNVTPTSLVSKSGCIIVDMAYRPAPTPLIRLARSVSRPEWRATEGNGGLLEQGYRSVQSMDNYEGTP